jgi:hypothetical protein
MAVQVEQIARRILLSRGEKVILDADLAAFYGVTTRRLRPLRVGYNRGTQVAS